MRLAACVFSALSLNAACVAVTVDSILAHDLAAANSAFESATPDYVISFAPIPGTQRIFSSHELDIIARKLVIPANARFAPICFERLAQRIEPEQMKLAMAAALTVNKDQIEIVDFSRYSMASGRIEFPRSGLATPPLAAPDTPVFWRGHVVFDTGRSAPIWAKVKVLVEVTVIVAAGNINQGQVIQENQVATVIRKQFPFATEFVNSVEQAVGKTARRSIAAGDLLRATLLEQSREIAQGDTVQVSALSGSAQITFEAHAQSGGRKGDSILVQNPSNGRTFRAKVVERGKVEVRP